MRYKRIFVICAVLVALAACASDKFQKQVSEIPPQKYQRPYGPNAPWNVAVKDLPRHAKSEVYVERLFNDAPDRPGNFNLTFNGYTYPVYYASQSQGLFPVKTTWKSNIDGKKIPWHPAWRPPHGTDAQVIILDLEKGLEWNLWQVKFEGNTVRATNGNLVQAGEEAGDGEEPANIWQKENGFKPSRGVGIQYLAMLVRPEEIMQGEIQHALSMPIKNTDGKEFVAPATKIEHPEHPADGIPEGMRFALRVSDKEIDQWVNELPKELPEATKASARVIAVALRDYGWFITDSSGAAHFQFESRVTSGEKWNALGLDEREIDDKKYPRDLLDGLISKERIYVIVPSDQYP